MKRIVLLAVVLVAAGCGTKASQQPPVTTLPAKPAKDVIAQTWTTFFAASTPVAERIALLQNGRRFAAIARQASASPLVKQVSVKVSSVTVHGSSATVVYSVLLNSKTALSNQRGVALKINGMWKVGSRSFCALLSLQGAPPRACVG